MKILITLILLCSAYVNVLHGQQKQLDSILTVIGQNKLTKDNTYKALSEAGDLLTNMNKNDSAILLFNKAQKLAGNQKDSSKVAEMLMKKGICHEQKGAYKEAADVYFQALAIAERTKDEPVQVKALINLGILNFNLQKGQTAIDYYTQAQKISEHRKDTLGIIRALNNIGNASASLLNDLKTAEKNFLKSVDLAKKTGYTTAEIVGYNNLTMIYANTNELDKAEKYASLAVGMCPNNTFAIYNLAGIWNKKGNARKAIIYYDSAFRYSENFPELKQAILKDKAEAEASINEFDKAFRTYKDYTTLKDSLHKTETDNHIKELDVKYQTATKEKEIITLSGQKKLQRFMLAFLAIILVVGGIASFNALRNIRHKKKIAEQAVTLHEQKIRELEKDKQLVATHAVLEGEEKERSRIARDLHDGLGGLLSGVKLKLTNIKGNYMVSKESAEHFENAVGLLDNSIKELRRVAHNMMPEALIKFGLKDALSDFCSQIASNKALKLNFNAVGTSARLEQTLEITIYRIALELINNALKHAQASEIIVQLIQDEKRIHLTIQDNGKGFDPEKVNAVTSSGLRNIQARVESFNGRLDIDSIPGQGTEIGVEFDLG
jgi:two-component system, NarL family, sensor kinase